MQFTTKSSSWAGSPSLYIALEALQGHATLRWGSGTCRPCTFGSHLSLPCKRPPSHDTMHKFCQSTRALPIRQKAVGTTLHKTLASLHPIGADSTLSFHTFFVRVQEPCSRLDFTHHIPQGSFLRQLYRNGGRRPKARDSVSGTGDLDLPLGIGDLDRCRGVGDLDLCLEPADPGTGDLDSCLGVELGVEIIPASLLRGFEAIPLGYELLPALQVLSAMDVPTTEPPSLLPADLMDRERVGSLSAGDEIWLAEGE